MQKLLVIPLLVFLTSNAFPQVKTFEALKYEVEIGLHQNYVVYYSDTFPDRGNSKTRFDELLLLPAVKAAAVYPIGEKMEVDMFGSYSVIGGKREKVNGTEELLKTKTIGIGFIPSYQLTRNLHTGIILEANYNMQPKRIAKNDQGNKITTDQTRMHNRYSFRTGLRADYRLGQIIIAGECSFNLTDLFHHVPTAGSTLDITKRNYNIGLSLGYRFN